MLHVTVVQRRKRDSPRTAVYPGRVERETLDKASPKCRWWIVPNDFSPGNILRRCYEERIYVLILYLTVPLILSRNRTEIILG